MYAISTNALELAPISSPGDPTREVHAAFPVHREHGAASTAVVYFTLEPGMHLGRHVDSAEELLIVLDGEVEATVGAESARVSAGGMALVPALVAHDVRNVGSTTARVCGVFSANTMVAVFDEPFSVMGMPAVRVTGTPAPGEASASASASAEAEASASASAEASAEAEVSAPAEVPAAPEFETAAA